MNLKFRMLANTHFQEYKLQTEIAVKWHNREVLLRNIDIQCWLQLVNKQGLHNLSFPGSEAKMSKWSHLMLWSVFISTVRYTVHTAFQKRSSNRKNLKTPGVCVFNIAGGKLDCSQSPIFPWDRRCRSLSSNRRHLGLLMRAKWGEYKMPVGRCGPWERGWSISARDRSGGSFPEQRLLIEPAVIFPFSNFSGVLVGTEIIWCVFRVKPPFSIFSSVKWMGLSSHSRAFYLNFVDGCAWLV